MVEIKLTNCTAKCWCDYCARGIQKDESYLDIRKSAWRGRTRTNICVICLSKIQIDKKKVRLMIEKEKLNKTERAI